VLDVPVESETHPITADGLRADFARDGQVPFVDLAVTVDEQSKQACRLMLNHDLESERELLLE
jgi:hypothetical protein